MKRSAEETIESEIAHHKLLKQANSSDIADSAVIASKDAKSASDEEKEEVSNLTDSNV